MKILLVNTFHFRGGGDSTYSFNLADLLRSNGHEVAFFAMNHEKSIDDKNSDLFVSYIDFRELNKNKNLMTGLHVLKRAIFSIEAKQKFRLMLKRFKPDIVHIQNIHGHITPSIIFEAKKQKLPVIWTLHDYKLICPNTHFLIDSTQQICESCGKNQYYRAVFKKCKKDSFLASTMVAFEAYCHLLMRVKNKVDFFLAPSMFLRDKLIERKYPSERVIHLPLFLPNYMFNTGFEDKGYIFFFGKIDPIKGIYTLLKACSQARDVNLIIAGGADKYNKRKVQGHLPSNGKYLGIKFGDELKKLLLEARAVILPSLWYENQPFSIIEAFAAGKPVIASDLGGMTELVKHNERGLLVPPGNIKELAQAMLKVSKQPALAKFMGENARKFAKEFYSENSHYNRLLKIYLKVLN